MNAPESKFLRLKAAVNWHLYELGHFFSQSRGFHTIPQAIVVCVLGSGADANGGGSETDLLREVVYEGEKNENDTEKNNFEFQHLQFIPIRKKKFDTLEIGISELDGSQTEFLNLKSISESDERQTHFSGGETILTVKDKDRRNDTWKSTK